MGRMHNLPLHRHLAWYRQACSGRRKCLIACSSIGLFTTEHCVCFTGSPDPHRITPSRRPHRFVRLENVRNQEVRRYSLAGR